MRGTYKILVIEDNMPDYVLLEKALKMIDDVDLDIYNAKDGQEGLDYVFKIGKHIDTPTPDIIILDLNLPVKSGFEVLKCLKSDALYKIIPIVIYSTSDETGDICASYSLYANSYITKTYCIEELFEKIKHFGNYWTKTVEMPDKNQCCLIDKEIK